MNQQELEIYRRSFFGDDKLLPRSVILSCHCGSKFSADPVEELFYPDSNDHDHPCGVEGFFISGFSDGFHQLDALIPKCPYCFRVSQRHKYEITRSISANTWFQKNTLDDVTKELNKWLAECDEKRKDIAFLSRIGDNTNRITVLQEFLESRPPQSTLLLHAITPERGEIYSNVIRRSWICEEEEFIWRIAWLWSTPNLQLSDSILKDNINRLIFLTNSIKPRGNLIFLADLNRQMGHWEESLDYLRKFDLTVEYNYIYLRLVRLYIEFFIKLRLTSRIRLNFSTLRDMTQDDEQYDENSQLIQFNYDSLTRSLSEQGLEVNLRALSECESLISLITKTSLTLPYFHWLR